MKKYKVYVQKKVVVFDTIEVQAACPMEAKRIARLAARQQDIDEALGQIVAIEVEGQKYPRYCWTEADTSYLTEIIK